MTASMVCLWRIVYLKRKYMIITRKRESRLILVPSQSFSVWRLTMHPSWTFTTIRRVISQMKKLTRWLIMLISKDSLAKYLELKIKLVHRAIIAKETKCIPNSNQHHLNTIRDFLCQKETWTGFVTILKLPCLCRIQTLIAFRLSISKTNAPQWLILLISQPSYKFILVDLFSSLVWLVCLFLRFIPMILLLSNIHF